METKHFLAAVTVVLLALIGILVLDKYRKCQADLHQCPRYVRNFQARGAP